ncbi:hypothetical protein MUN74_15095 [Agromyces endophyticus]|uniref:hypothetical protein n=1 Tax=Agromyces sp. H17E-10 TaxID=2932244 RepID=UPI001FD5ABBD|nr:hypothetical protein [Agromyces sp. H17E-10]UOQ88581.1 hypothetical protein MUN74_15095 [Agromyces sp. H17E-10]
MLEIEPGGDVVEATCDHCGQPMTRVTGFVYQDGDAHAIYIASCYHHDGHEVWIDGVFSPTWADDADDHFTFGCRVGPVEGQAEPGASLVAAAAPFSDSATFGHKLTRDEALAHPRLGDFWALVDHLLTNDAVVSAHMYGPAAELD